MINRQLIRLKVVQLVYAYYGNKGRTLETAEKEFLFSLSKTYELYQSLLLLMVNITHIATRIVEVKQSRARRLHQSEDIPTKFIQNRFIAQLRDNEQLRAFQDKQTIVWSDYDTLLRKIYLQIIEQDFYKAYLKKKTNLYDEDRELWRKIYRTLLCDNEELDEVFEDNGIYWNDDKAIVDTFVLKTIRYFDERKGSLNPILPQFKDSEDQVFAVNLFRTAIRNQDYFRQLIAAQTLNWELERIATMDLIIMQIALAEITSYEHIPLSISINEYVEIAKMYSTPRSGSYINGMLDTIAKRLIAENKIAKVADTPQDETALNATGDNDADNENPESQQ